MKPKHIKTRYTGKTFATASKKISDKYKDRDVNPLSKRSFLAEIEELMKMQELVRSQEAATSTLQENKRFIKATGGLLSILAQGGMLPKLGLGGDGISRSINDGLAPPNTYLGLNSSSLITPLQKNINPLMLSSPATVVSPNLRSSAIQSQLTPLPSRSATSVGPTLQQRAVTELGNELTPLKERAVAAAKNKNNKFLSNMMDPLIVGKAAEFLGKGAMALGGYDRYSPILNPYESQSRRELENLRFDITPVQQRLQQEGARGRSTVSGIQNEAVRQALLQNTQSEVMGRTQEAMLSGQQQENQYRQARAAGLQSLGAEQVAARNLSEQLTTQSKAGYQQSLLGMLTGVGQAGQEITDYRANTAQQQLLASTLKTKNFAIQDVDTIFKKARQMGLMTEDDMYKFIKLDEAAQAAYVETMNKNIQSGAAKKRFGGVLPGLKL